MPRSRIFGSVLAGTLLVTLLWAGVPFGVERALAQGTGLANPITGVMTVAALAMGQLINVLNFLAWFLFMLLDIVMDPAWIFDLQSNNADGSLINMLREIWQLCRDLVNIGLAMLLIYEAMVMIVKADGSKIKEMLPKFVIALIAVNFSWFIPRAIFDVSQVLTYTVYQIPTMVGQDGCAVSAGTNGESKPCEIATQFAFFEDTNRMNRVGANQYQNQADGSLGWSCPLERIVCVRFEPYNNVDNLSKRSQILNGLIINYGRLRNLTVITDPRPPTGAPTDFSTFDALLTSGAYIVKLAIVLVIHVAIVFPLMAMVAAFFMRIPVLWITMAAMPLVALGFVAGEKLGDFNPMKIVWEQFLSAVLLPVKVAVPFTVSFILFNVGSTARPPDVQALTQLVRPLSIFSDISSIWQMLWMLIALFILWKYSFEILKKDELMGKFAGKFEELGQSLGSVAMKIPMSAPIIPGPGGATSVTRMLRAGNLREIEAGLSRGDTIGEVLRNRGSVLAGGRAPDSERRTREAGEAITKVAATLDPSSVTAITNLVTHASRPPATVQAELTTLINNVRSQAGISAATTDEEVLNAIMTSDSAGRFRDETLRRQLRDLLRSRPATPPAGPTTPPPPGTPAP